MKVIIAGYFGFPSGGAPAARVRNFALGFRECGAEVRVLAMAPMIREPNAPLRTPLFYRDIIYQKTSLIDLGTSLYGSGTRNFARRLRWFVGLYGAMQYTYHQVAANIDSNHCDLLFVYSRSAVLVYPLVKLCQKYGIPSIMDITELPESFGGFGKKLSPVYWDWQLGSNYMPRDFDIVSTITKGLAAKYTEMGCSQVVVTPSIESWDNLPPVNPLPHHKIFRLVYVGALIDRDAPEVLFEAMRLLGQQNVPVQLNLLGRFREIPDSNRWIHLCETDPNLQKTVKLVGWVSDAELRQHFNQADGFILMRRNAPTEIYSFPTRLVEYLKVGRPVFVSAVGDIADYLQDGKDAIFLSTSDSSQVAQAIADIVINSEKGRAIGHHGRQTGSTIFNRKEHGARILAFAEQLREKKTFHAG